MEGSVLGSKPCLIFSGDQFETDSSYARLKNLLTGEARKVVFRIFIEFVV